MGFGIKDGQLSILGTLIDFSPAAATSVVTVIIVVYEQ